MRGVLCHPVSVHFVPHSTKSGIKIGADYCPQEMSNHRFNFCQTNYIVKILPMD